MSRVLGQISVLVVLWVLHQAVLGYGREVVPMKSGVLQISATNFKAVLSEHKLVLVLFCAEWVSKCRYLRREFQDTARLL